MGSGFITALRTLTLLPVRGPDAKRFADALPWFPLVGALVGLGVLVPALLVAHLAGGSAMVAAAVGLACSVILTRGLHLDGLADWADGFFGAYDHERALEIMKDSHTGAFGVVALVVVLLAKFAALSTLIAAGAWPWIVVPHIVARTMQVQLATALPYARSEGTARRFVEGADRTHRNRALALGLALVMLATIAGLAAVLFVAGGLLLATAFGGWCRRRVGGITGDLLGAGNELVETALLLTAAVLF